MTEGFNFCAGLLNYTTGSLILSVQFFESSAWLFWVKERFYQDQSYPLSEFFHLYSTIPKFKILLRALGQCVTCNYSTFTSIDYNLNKNIFHSVINILHILDIKINGGTNSLSAIYEHILIQFNYAYPYSRISCTSLSLIQNAILCTEVHTTKTSISALFRVLFWAMIGFILEQLLDKCFGGSWLEQFFFEVTVEK